LIDGTLDNPINIDENGNAVARIRVNTGQVLQAEHLRRCR